MPVTSRVLRLDLDVLFSPKVDFCPQNGNVYSKPGLLGLTEGFSAESIRKNCQNSAKYLIVTVLYKGEDSEQSESEENYEENVIDVCGINVGEWVVVEYDGKKYPGKVTSKGEAGLQVSVMKPCFPSGWSWPDILKDNSRQNRSKDRQRSGKDTVWFSSRVRDPRRNILLQYTSSEAS